MDELAQLVKDAASEGAASKERKAREKKEKSRRREEEKKSKKKKKKKEHKKKSSKKSSKKSKKRSRDSSDSSSSSSSSSSDDSGSDSDGGGRSKRKRARVEPPSEGGWGAPPAPPSGSAGLAAASRRVLGPYKPSAKASLPAAGHFPTAFSLKPQPQGGRDAGRALYFKVRGARGGLVGDGWWMVDHDLTLSCARRWCHAPSAPSSHAPRPTPHAPRQCATCGVEASGEASFAEHINGSKHRLKARMGFAGLLPNRAGVIPPLTDPQLRAAALRFNPKFYVDGTDAQGRPLPPNPKALQRGKSGNGPFVMAVAGGPWTPPIRRVDIDNRTLATVRSHLGTSAGGGGGGGIGGGGGGGGGGGIGGPHANAAAAAEEIESSDSESESDSDEAEVDAAAAERSRRELSRLTPPRNVDPPGGPMRRQREGLPVFAHRSALLQALNGHRQPVNGRDRDRDRDRLLSGASVIEGETGSGKTTQVCGAGVWKGNRVVSWGPLSWGPFPALVRPLLYTTHMRPHAPTCAHMRPLNASRPTPDHALALPFERHVRWRSSSSRRRWRPACP